jgi:hypothetical protein
LFALNRIDFRKRMNASVPENANDDHYVDVQACDIPSTSSVQKSRGVPTSSRGLNSFSCFQAQKRKAMMYEETDNRLMEKRRVTNAAFAEFVACKLDEMPEPIRSHTERQIIDLIMSVHVETYQEISQSSMQPMHSERDLPIAADIYHPPSNNAPEPNNFENCQTIPKQRPRARNVRQAKCGE